MGGEVFNSFLSYFRRFKYDIHLQLIFVSYCPFSDILLFTKFVALLPLVKLQNVIQE